MMVPPAGACPVTADAKGRGKVYRVYHSCCSENSFSSVLLRIIRLHIAVESVIWPLHLRKVIEISQKLSLSERKSKTFVIFFSTNLPKLHSSRPS